MCLFKYGLSVEHDSIDPRHLLKQHQHDADYQRLVDTRVLQVGHPETGVLRENRSTAVLSKIRSVRHFIIWDCRLDCLTLWVKQSLQYLLKQWSIKEKSLITNHVLTGWHCPPRHSQANQPQTHLLIAGVLDAGALPFDGGVRSSQEA